MKLEQVGTPSTSELKCGRLTTVGRISHRRFYFGLWILVLLLCLAVPFAASYGAAPIPVKVILSIFLHHLGISHGALTWPKSTETIILQIRLPRVIAASLIGAALSVAGVIFQGLLRNPLADPYVIGTSGGAALGATFGFLISAHFSILGFGIVPALAFCGALSAVAVAYWLARTGARTPVVTLLLAGFALSVILSYSMSLLLILNDRLQLNLRVLYSWLLGGVSVTAWAQVEVIAVLVFLAGGSSLAFAKSLNAMSLGDDTAQLLGVPVERHRAALLSLGSTLTGIAVVGGGLIGFVGLIVPHALRMIFGPEHSRLLLLSAVAGAVFLVIADLLCRILIPPNELPVGILTAFIGGPLFLYLLRRSKREYRF